MENLITQIEKFGTADGVGYENARVRHMRPRRW
jgi:hypothetical protein